MVHVLASGTLFDDRYRPLEYLGGGAYGEVWKASDTTTGRTVALKIINPAFTTPDMAWMEATHLTSLESPHLVRVHGAAMAIDVPYIDMELSPGGSAASAVSPYGIDAATSVRWAQQVARGLELCHARRLLHRDIKPGNILLDGVGGVLLGDFGVAAVMAPDGSATEHGDANIRAPEAFGGHCSVASDVYSLGVSLYYFLTGHYPIDLANFNDLSEFIASVRAGIPDIRDSAPQVNRTLASVLRKATEVDPTQRFQTAAELDRALAKVKPPKRSVKEVVPHVQGGRCWDAMAFGGKKTNDVHVCSLPTLGDVSVEVRYVKSGKKIRKHCTTIPLKNGDPLVHLRRVFQDIS